MLVYHLKFSQQGELLTCTTVDIFETTYAEHVEINRSQSRNTSAFLSSTLK